MNGGNDPEKPDRDPYNNGDKDKNKNEGGWNPFAGIGKMFKNLMNQEPDFGDGYENLPDEVIMPPVEIYSESNTNRLLDDMFALKQEEQLKKELANVTALEAPVISDYID